MIRTLVLGGLLAIGSVTMLPTTSAETGCFDMEDIPFGNVTVSPQDCITYVQGSVDKAQCTVDEIRGRPCE